MRNCEVKLTWRCICQSYWVEQSTVESSRLHRGHFANERASGGRNSPKTRAITARWFDRMFEIRVPVSSFPWALSPLRDVRYWIKWRDDCWNFWFDRLFADWVTNKDRTSTVYPHWCDVLPRKSDGGMFIRSISDMISNHLTEIWYDQLVRNHVLQRKHFRSLLVYFSDWREIAQRRECNYVRLVTNIRSLTRWSVL